MNSIIELQPEVLKEVTHVANRYNQSADEVVNQAVREFLSRINRHKIRAEKKHYLAQHAALREEYLHQYIAMHEGQVIDHDQDLVVLNNRIRERYGQTAILITRVEEEPEREIMIRSPRLERPVR